jgi:hypothetical protein
VDETSGDRAIGASFKQIKETVHDNYDQDVRCGCVRCRRSYAIDATGNAFAGQLVGVVRAPNLTKNSGLTGLIPVPKVLPNPLPCRRFRSANRIPLARTRGTTTSGHGRYDYAGFSDYGSCYFIKKFWTILKVCPD